VLGSNKPRPLRSVHRMRAARRDTPARELGEHDRRIAVVPGRGNDAQFEVRELEVLAFRRRKRSPIDRCSRRLFPISNAAGFE